MIDEHDGDSVGWPAWWMWAAPVVVIGLLYGGYRWYAHARSEPTPAVPAAVEQPGTPATPAAATPAAGDAGRAAGGASTPLPPIETDPAFTPVATGADGADADLAPGTAAAADECIRARLGTLSARPELAAWVAACPGSPVQRFVAVVDLIANGSSPKRELECLKPATAFQPGQRGGRPVLDDAAGRRYDLPVAVFVSLDTTRCARLYRAVAPVLDTVYQDMGYPEGSFRTAVGEAAKLLLAVPMPAEPPVLVPRGRGYAYAATSLEQLSDVQKHLLRLGPANARRVQAKVRELAAAAGLSAGPAP